MRPAHGSTPALGIVSATISAHIMDTGTAEFRTLKGKTMLTVFEKLMTAARNQARYRQTRNEIARLPMDVALDLGIYPGDADELARKAVWGK
jgi:uncharacterized protein YjiS (DUF1127 family)